MVVENGGRFDYKKCLDQILNDKGEMGIFHSSREVKNIWYCGASY